MSTNDLKSVAIILFWWNVATMRNIPPEIIERIENAWKLYLNFSTQDEARRIAPATRDAVETNLDAINEILIRHNIQDDTVGVFSMLFFFAEWFIDRTNNAERRAWWRELFEAIQTHPLQEEINATTDYDYLNRAEAAFTDIQRLLERIDYRHYMKRTKPMEIAA